MSSRRPNEHLVERPIAAHIFATQFSELQLNEVRHRAPVTFGDAFDNLGGWPNRQANNHPAHANQLMWWEPVGNSFANDFEGNGYSTEDGDHDEDYEDEEEEDDENEDNAPLRLPGRLTYSSLSNFRLDIPCDMLNVMRSAFGGVEEGDGQEDDHEYPNSEEVAVDVPLRSDTGALALRPRVILLCICAMITPMIAMIAMMRSRPASGKLLRIAMDLAWRSIQSKVRLTQHGELGTE